MKDAPAMPKMEESALGTEQSTKDAVTEDAPTKLGTEGSVRSMEQRKTLAAKKDAQTMPEEKKEYALGMGQNSTPIKLALTKDAPTWPGKEGSV